MLLQTNSYIVPKEKRAEHARLMRRFRQVLNGLGCDDFEIFEQVGANWSGGETSGRFVQIMRFRDRKHQLAVQNAERGDPAAQQLIAEFCALVDYPTQQQQRQFAVGFYSSILPVGPGQRVSAPAEPDAQPPEPTDADHDQSAAVPVTAAAATATVAHDQAEAPLEDAQAAQAHPVVDEGDPEELLTEELTAEAEPIIDQAPESHEHADVDAAAPEVLDGEQSAAAAPEASLDPLDEEPFGTLLDAPAEPDAAQPPPLPHAHGDNGMAHDDLTDLDVLDGDLELDDDLSRLASELASREGDTGAHHHGGGGANGHSSENGAH